MDNSARNKPGWAMELKGDRLDLDEIRRQLPYPFEPWTEEYGAGDGTRYLLLRSCQWADTATAAEVALDARHLVERLNGMALLVFNDSRPVTLGSPMKFGPTGKREHILFAASSSYVMKGSRVRGRITVGDEPTEPQETQVQKWIKGADSSDVRAELFVHLSRADNWFDVYKSMELARRLADETQADVAELVESGWNDWRRVWQTANCHRHAPNLIKYPFPPNPPSFDEARGLMLKLIGLVVSKLS